LQFSLQFLRDESLAGRLKIGANAGANSDRSPQTHAECQVRLIKAKPVRRTVRCEPTVAKQHLFVESPSHTFASPTMCLCCATISTGEMGIVETFGYF
jgi:hypothetical protein